jgi:hypothetical protein
MTADKIAASLGNARRCGRWWRTVCPVHGSRTGRSLTLALRDHARGLAVHCHAGCNRDDIIAPQSPRRTLARPIIPVHGAGSRACMRVRVCLGAGIPTPGRRRQDHRDQNG